MKNGLRAMLLVVLWQSIALNAHLNNSPTLPNSSASHERCYNKATTAAIYHSIQMRNGPVATAAAIAGPISDEDLEIVQKTPNDPDSHRELLIMMYNTCMKAHER